MRLIITARLSRLAGAARFTDGLGIETQDERVRAWAESEGHEVVAVIPDIKGGTVAPWDRKNLRPWVTEPAKMALYDGVAAYKNDRLSRGCWEDETDIRKWATRHGKKLVIANGPQWPPRNEGDKWAWEANAMQANREWEEIRERNMRTQKKLLERGSMVGKPPWGYRIEGEYGKKTLVPTEDGRRLVPEMFERCIRGESLARIAEWLAEETWQGIPWAWPVFWPSTLATWMRNPTYIGRRCERVDKMGERDPRGKYWGRAIMLCEPLVDAATFRRAQDALEDRPKRGPVKAANRAMLGGGVLFCPRCGGDSPMYRIKARTKGADLYYYRCTGRGTDRHGCGNMVRAERADATVNAIIARYWDTPVMRETVVPGNEAEIEARLAEIRFEIRQLAALDLSDEEFDARMADLRAERDKAAAEPVRPERVELLPTGEVYAQLWARMPENERGPWLKRNGFKVYATKEHAMVAKGGKEAELALITP